MLQDENYNEDYLAEIDRMRKMTDPIIMFGAGLGKEYDLDYLRHLEIFPKAICDNNPQKWGKKVYDLQIQSFESIKKNFPNAYFYVTANHYFEDIVKQITEAGYPKDRISKFIIILYFKNEDVSVEYYQKHNKELEKLASLLGDEKSREVLRNRILFHKTRERKLMLNIRSENQYFDEGLFNVKGISTYVDIGAYTGDSIERFVNLSMGKYMQIYGFEPDINFCAKANERLKKYSNVNCVPLGLSDQTGDYYADATTGNMMTIDKATFNVDKKTEKIFHIVRLDDFFKEKDEKID